MTLRDTVNVEDLIDRQKFSRFHLTVLCLSFLAMIADGYDLQSAAFAAPELIKVWGVPKAALAPVFSAGLFGLLVGAPIFGIVGDRIGRKRAIIAGLCIAGVFTLASTQATSLLQLMFLRFVIGIGIGAVLPNTIALTADLAPKRLRATMVVLMFTGITIGGALPGLVAATLIPAYGWPILFWVGGVMPLITAVLLAFYLPESIGFLVLQRAGRDRLVSVIRRIAPDLSVGPETNFTMRARPEHAGATAALFAGRFALVTPLLWLLFVMALLTNYFLGSWMPVVFESAGLSPGNAALINSMFQLGGMAGGIAVSLVLDRFGFKVVALLFALACPIVAFVGTPGLGVASLAAAVGASGFCIIGLQFALNASAGLIYPTAFRSTGVGWAFGVGRVGSVFGPFLGAALIARDVSTQTLFLAPVVPLSLGAAAALLLLWQGRLLASAKAT